MESPQNKIIDMAISTFTTLSHFVVEQPIYPLFVFPMGFLIAVHCYCRYTVGMCDCKQDMTGKTVIITGGNTGIGRTTAEELAKRGARIILACRSEERGSQAVEEIVSSTGNRNVIFKQLDLSIFSSIRNFVKEMLETEPKIHILINNAGISGAEKRQITVNCCERVFQTNHLGPFLLTTLLLDLLKKSKPSRIIVVSSMVYKYAKLDLDDLLSNRNYNPVNAYNNSKLANILFTTELSKKLEDTGVTVNCLHPGVVKTEISREATGIIKFVTRLVFVLVGKTPLEGAQTTLHLALDPALERVTGKYFSDCKEEKLASKACDEKLAQLLWKRSANIVKDEDATE